MAEWEDEEVRGRKEAKGTRDSGLVRMVGCFKFSAEERKKSLL
jgi:hypothetical protein